MGLVGPWLSTTSTKKRKTKITKAQQEEFERGWKDRNQRLKEMKLPKETFKQYMEWVYGLGKKKKTEEKNKSKDSSTNANSVAAVHLVSGIANAGSNKADSRDTQNKKYSSFVDGIPGSCGKKPSPTYTGTKMIGIAVLHKSCLQPIFSNEEAIEVAKMRR
jgi:hypothetical protein